MIFAPRLIHRSMDFMDSPLGRLKNSTSHGSISSGPAEKRSPETPQIRMDEDAGSPANRRLEAWRTSAPGWARRRRSSSPPPYPAAPATATVVRAGLIGLLPRSGRSGQHTRRAAPEMLTPVGPSELRNSIVWFDFVDLEAVRGFKDIDGKGPSAHQPWPPAGRGRPIPGRPGRPRPGRREPYS